MRKNLFLIIFMLIAPLQGALVQNTIEPSSILSKQNYNSIVVFPFDGQKIKKYDFLTISKQLQQDLIQAFNSRTELEAVPNAKVNSINEKIRLSIQKGNLKIKDYTQRDDSRQKITTSHPSKQISILITGTINNFYISPNYGDSFINLTIQVADSKSKVVYWTTTISGCYQFVINSIVDTIEQKKYVGPSVKDVNTYVWVNPQKDRLLVQAVGYDFGGILPLGKLNNNISSKVFGHLNAYFTLPYLLPVRNKISLAVSPAFQDKINTNAQYKFTTLNISFLYDIPYIHNFDWMPKKLSVAPYMSLGLLYEYLSYPGYTYQVDAINNITYLITPGLSFEYYLNPMTFRYKTLIFYLPKIGFVADFNFDFFEFYNSTVHYKLHSFFNLNLGLKFYL